MTKTSKAFICGIVATMIITAAAVMRTEQVQRTRNIDWLETRVETCNIERKSLYYELRELHTIVEQARYLTSCTPTSNNKIMLCVAEEEN